MKQTALLIMQIIGAVWRSGSDIFGGWLSVVSSSPSLSLFPWSRNFLQYNTHLKVDFRDGCRGSTGYYGAVGLGRVLG